MRFSHIMLSYPRDNLGSVALTRMVTLCICITSRDRQLWRSLCTPLPWNSRARARSIPRADGAILKPDTAKGRKPEAEVRETRSKLSDE